MVYTRSNHAHLYDRGKIEFVRSVVFIGLSIIGAVLGLMACIQLVRLAKPFKEADGFGAFQRVMRSNADHSANDTRDPSPTETPNN